MKKLALVLGSLLVVGSVASAKEVMPAPVAAPEVVVKVVEKPVVVYKEREAAWRPNGDVKVSLRYEDKIEGHKVSDNDDKDTEYKYEKGKIVKKEKSSDTDWAGADGKVRLRTDVGLNFTPKQKLDIRYDDWYGVNRSEKGSDKHDLTRLTHTYTFDNLDKVQVQAQTRFQSKGSSKMLRERVVFDFADYFFKNDYIKATALQLAPEYSYNWTKTDRYSNNLGLYANAEFELPYGVTFQAEFDDFFKYSKENRSEVTDAWREFVKAEHNFDYGRTSKTGSVELTLAKDFELYKMDRHTLGLNLKGVYATTWAWSRSTRSVYEAGTFKDEYTKKERWGDYTAKFEPSLNYSYKATDFVTLSAKVGGEYVNRTEERHDAQTWRWQPYAEVGFKTTF